MKNVSPALRIVFALVVVFFACLQIFSFIESRAVMPQVKGFVREFYLRYNSRDFDYLYNTLASPKFKANISRQDFRKLMGIVYANLGKARDLKISGWKIRHSKIGLYCEARYRTRHDNAEAKEAFTLIRSVEGVWFVSGYHINSKNLILKK